MISRGQRVEEQAPAKYLSELQSSQKHHEELNISITDSTSDVVENAKSEINAQVDETF